LILAVSATAGFPAKFSVPRSIPRKIAVENPGEYADNATINYTEVAMPLGRFAAYFCLLMITCLVVFPRMPLRGADLGGWKPAGRVS
jgi:hypothetical protein